MELKNTFSICLFLVVFICVWCVCVFQVLELLKGCIVLKVEF